MNLATFSFPEDGLFFARDDDIGGIELHCRLSAFSTPALLSDYEQFVGCTAKDIVIEYNWSDIKAEIWLKKKSKAYRLFTCKDVFTDSVPIPTTEPKKETQEPVGDTITTMVDFPTKRKGALLERLRAAADGVDLDDSKKKQNDKTSSGPTATTAPDFFKGASHKLSSDIPKNRRCENWSCC